MITSKWLVLVYQLLLIMSSVFGHKSLLENGQEKVAGIFGLLNHQLDLSEKLSDLVFDSRPVKHRRLLRVKVCKYLYKKKLEGFRTSLHKLNERMRTRRIRKSRMQFQTTVCGILNIVTVGPLHGSVNIVTSPFSVIQKARIADCEAALKDYERLETKLVKTIEHTEMQIQKLELLPQDFNLNRTGIVEGEDDL